MKVTVDISEKDLRDIMRFSKEKKKGPAITKYLCDKLQLERRRELLQEFAEGRAHVDFPNWEAYEKAQWTEART
ncbi:MAG: hypothetical protein SFU85_03100 [Candidatus Methylacidiphilales bacterium]|nr:hypothetical protein [Candidatus Methylacidiphilales bacterium]